MFHELFSFFFADREIYVYHRPSLLHDVYINNILYIIFYNLPFFLFPEQNFHENDIVLRNPSSVTEE